MPEKINLDSGVRLLIDPIETSETVSLGLWINLGSRDEGEEEHGFSHFVEHVLFKGTGRRNYYDIALEVDGIGGEINGSTDKENTSYYINVASLHAPKAVDILTDLYLNPLFDQGEFEKEKIVILGEIDMLMDDPEDYVNDVFSRTLWGNLSFALPVVGDKKDILNAKVDDLKSFYQRNYCIDRMVISAAGKIDRKDFIKQTESILRGYIAKNPPDSQKAVRVKPNSRVSRKTVKRDIEQIHFLCGAEGYGYRDEKRYALTLLNMILGNSFSSRLFQKVREREGLCYTISSNSLHYSDVGEVTISFSTSLKNIPLVLESVNRELKLINTGDITIEELRRAKDKFKGNFLLAKESNDWKMVRMAVQELIYGHLIPYDETIRKVEAVKLEDINQIADDIFKGKRFSFASVGPEGHERVLEGFQFSF